MGYEKARLEKKTPLLKIDGSYYGFSNLWLKDESRNPTGTYKDRRSRHIIQNARKAGVDKLVLITAGNAGYSLTKYAQPYGIEVASIVDENTPEKIFDALRSVGSRVIRHTLQKVLTSEEILALAGNKRKTWDVSNGFHAAYSPIVDELHTQGGEFDFLICPVGSGEAFIGICEEVKKRKLRTKVIGMTSLLPNKLRTIYTPYLGKLREEKKNGNYVFLVDDLDVAYAWRDNERNHEIELASAVVWGGLPLMKGLTTAAKTENKIVLINSGSGLSQVLPPQAEWFLRHHC
jgi:hypothetical protein